MSIPGSIQERTILLNVNDHAVELTSSKVPAFTPTTISIIKELNEHKIDFNSHLESSKHLGTRVAKLATKIEELENAKDHKTRNIILSVLQGALYASVVAATVFAGIAAFTATTTAFLPVTLPTFIGGVVTSLGMAAWNVNNVLPITHWADYFIAIPIAPFAPLFAVFSNISKLEEDVTSDADKINLLLSSLSDFYTNEENMEQIKEMLKKQITELEKMEKQITDLQMAGVQTIPIITIQEQKAKKETALNELEAAIEFFKNLPKKQEV